MMRLARRMGCALMWGSGVLRRRLARVRSGGV